MTPGTAVIKERRPMRLVVGSLAMLLAALEALDAVKMTRRMALRGLSTWWAGVERRQRRELRFSAAGYLLRQGGGGRGSGRR